jgi:hypothetical protein
VELAQAGGRAEPDTVQALPRGVGGEGRVGQGGAGWGRVDGMGRGGDVVCWAD